MVLRPKKRGKNSSKPHKIFGFDVETYGEKNLFYMGSVYSDDGVRVFYDKSEMKKYILGKRIIKSKSYVVATNLMFDFFALFDYDELEGFDLIFRGSELILVNKKITYQTRKYKVKFIDTFHFAVKFSVKQLGKIINCPKLDTPIFIGEIPNNEPYVSMLEDKKTYSQKEYLEIYNIRDSEITYKFTKFWEDSLILIGAELLGTIATTSLNYFRLKYLKDSYTVLNDEMNQFIYRAYFGGRTEVFKRGKVSNINYYDINSLYPYCMLKPMPNPNTIINVDKGALFYIENYEGVTEVEITCPNIKIPLLPVRLDNKLIFPKGNIKGVFTHIELRKALQLGYKIKSIGRSIYSVESIEIFKEFVTDNYNKRLEYKKKGESVEYVFKIILNSLYGKFGQRYNEKQEICHINDFDFSKVEDYLSVDVLREFFVITNKENFKPPKFSQVIWSTYVTAYGRLELYKYFEEVGFDNVYYCDTDSIFTNKDIVTGNDLGNMKLECKVKRGLIIKPKFYEIDGYVKAKGLKGFNKRENLLQLLEEKKFKSTKFIKFKESLRRKEVLKVNQIIDIEKRIDFEDNKRDWDKKSFSTEKLQDSNPISL